MDLVETTQVIKDNNTENNCEDKVEVGSLKIESESHKIYKGFNRIGRSPICQVVLSDVTVSKVHAEIQAGVETTFISDLRSSNGTKIKDSSLIGGYNVEEISNTEDCRHAFIALIRVIHYLYSKLGTDSLSLDATCLRRIAVAESLLRISSGKIRENCNYFSMVSIKPFHYYTINDGDVIYFGQVRAEYTTTIKTTESNDFVVPETPAVSKNRYGSEKRYSGNGNVSEESFLNDSSMDDSDVSLIPGTQETAKNQTLQKQSITVKNSSNVSLKVTKTRKREDDAQVTDIHDMETQNDVDLLCRPPVSKRLRLQKNRENDHGNETNIHEAETQAMPIMSPKRKEIETLENQDDIFDAETQAMPIQISNKKNSKKLQIQDDIFEAETQGLPMPIRKEKNVKKYSKKSQNQEDIYDAETQAMPIKNVNKFSKKLQIQDDIFEAETQGLPMPIRKEKNVKKDSKKSQNQEDIYDAETQAMEISDGETFDNIHEMATQILSRPLQNNDKDQLNETAESSLRSNFSGSRLRLSSTPPSSPENLDDMCESQNLLEIAETPLLAYDKIETKKSPHRRPVQTIPESSESETDDERPITRILRKTKPSNVIEDSSDEDATDEENVFGASAIKGKILKKNIREKSTGTPIVEDSKKLEANNVRNSSLHLKKNRQASPEKILSGESSNREKSLQGISENSPITIDEFNEETEPKKMVNSPTSQDKKRENVSMKKSTESLINKLGASPLRLARKKNQNSSTSTGKIEEIGQVKSNLFEDFEKKNDGTTMKNQVDHESKKCQDSPQKNDSSMKHCGESPSKKFDSPTIIFQNGEEISIEKNNDKLINDFDASTSTKSKNQGDIMEKSKNTKNQEDSNTIRNSPKKNDQSSKIQEESSSINEPLSPNKSGRSSLCLLRKGDNNSPTKTDKILEKSKQLEESSLRKRCSIKIRNDKKIEDNCEEDIFETTNQRINSVNVAISIDKKSNDKNQNFESTTSIEDDIDIDLLPTQILDVPSSTPFTRKTRTGKNIARQEFDGDDLHCAPTQITNVESIKKGNFDNDNNEEKIVDKKKKETNENSIDLNDSVAINLGRLLGEEGDNKNFNDEDATQLMTQNLVDILRPSQNLNETESHGRISSPRVLNNIIGQGTFDSPLRKRIYAPGTLGFIDGEAKDGEELVSADSSPIKEAKSDENIVEADKADKDDKLEPSASHSDEDDIFFGLPEVKIAGTLAYPGSPVSKASSPEVSPRSIINNLRLKNFGKKRSFSNLGSSTSKTILSTDPDSPITPKKSRITRRDVARYRIIDDAPEDSEDDFDYQDLKRMADRLLATESSYAIKTDEKNKLDDKKKIDKISVSMKNLRKEKKNIETKKNIGIANNIRTTKVSCGPSSFIVSDSEKVSSGKLIKISSKKKTFSNTQMQRRSASHTIDDNKSLGETRKSTRQRKPTEKAVALSKTEVIGKEQQQQQNSSIESQEIEAILGSSTDENLPMISRKSYVKVQLTRLDDSKEQDDEKINNVLERPKVTRTRRTISAVKKEESLPLAPPAKRARRTIAETPGCTGKNEIDHKIMFTGVNADSYSKIVEKLGGTLVSEPSKATVLITDKVRRTYKFLCAVAHGIRVVSINWLLESNKASKFLDCDKYILQEPAAEAKYKFKLEQSLKIAKTKKFLEGYTIVITPKVNQPEVHELKAMVEAGGGRLLVRPPGPRSWNAKTVIISREEDYAVAKSYLAKVPKNLKITVHSTEFILTGILRQEVNLVEHILNFT